MSERETERWGWVGERASERDPNVAKLNALTRGAVSQTPNQQDEMIGRYSVYRSPLKKMTIMVIKANKQTNNPSRHRTFCFALRSVFSPIFTK